MIKSLIILFLSANIAIAGHSLKLNENFITAIHQVETGGRDGKIYGDNGKALGSCQIHYSYWHDATEFDKTIGGKYEDCANFDYSKRIIAAYLSRYAPNAIKSNDFKTLARIHNGGPNGNQKSATIPYAEKVEREMVKLNKNKSI